MAWAAVAPLVLTAGEEVPPSLPARLGLGVMAGVDPGQWSSTPLDKTAIQKLSKNLGDTGHMEVEAMDPKVANLKHICLIRVSAAGRTDKSGRVLTALSCSARPPRREK